MERTNNYALQAAQARQHFLEYDPQTLARKLGAALDEQYLTVRLLSSPHRICLKTGKIQWLWKETWLPADSHEEVMTLLDLVCDSREDRHLSGSWKGMSSFGMQFHQNLLEDQRDEAAEAIQADPEAFSSACEALGGRRIGSCDLGYAVELFDGLEIGMQFWYGDEEFYPRLRYLWDENALQYLRYETMFYAVSVLQRRLHQAK